MLLDPTYCSFLKIAVNTFSERRVLFTHGLGMATSTRFPVYLPIVLNHVVHVALFKLHYFGFAFQLLSPLDIPEIPLEISFCIACCISRYFVTSC